MVPCSVPVVSLEVWKSLVHIFPCMALVVIALQGPGTVYKRAPYHPNFEVSGETPTDFTWG